MDPRIVRTQQALQRALLELTIERGFDEVTIGEIAERAGVNRSSFYQHYADKETLLADALDVALEDAALTIPTTTGPTSSAEPPKEFVALLRHIAEHAELYRWALGAHGSAAVADRIRERAEALTRHHLAIAGEAAPHRDIPAAVVAASIAGAAMGALRAWLETEPPAPVELAARWTWQMLIGGPSGTDALMR